MFTNLKNKLIEDVKASPSKFRQIANAAQAAVSSSTSTTPSGSDTNTTNENFFSITEEDTPQNSPYKPLKMPGSFLRGRTPSQQSVNNGTSGAVPRTRKLSNSSMVSDMSFRLPNYESNSTYNFYSDLETSGSEMGDSTSIAKLDVFTKEQLYDAYKKSLERYNKYRSRYTDMAKKFKDLEQDSTKARSVLVETQEKAIRRINELREQCTLEQQAKAHLEEALRNEIDDMQCKLQTYETKLKVLDENSEHLITSPSGNNNQLIDQLIDLSITNSEEYNSNKVESFTESSKKIEQLEEQLQEYKELVAQLTAKVEENAILTSKINQSKETEVEKKNGEIKKLTDVVEQMQDELQNFTRKQTVLNNQLADLKEKIKQSQSSKQEVDAKLIASDHMLSELKEKNTTTEANLITTKNKLEILKKESDSMLSDLQHQNTQLTEMVQRYQKNEITIAEVDNELSKTKADNTNLKASLIENSRKFVDLERALTENQDLLKKTNEQNSILENEMKNENLVSENLKKQLEEEGTKLKETELFNKQLQSQLEMLNEQHAQSENATIAALQSELNNTKTDLSIQLSATQEQLNNREKEIKATTNKLNKQKKHHENHHSQMKTQTDEIDKLKTELNKHEQHLETIEMEARQREQQVEQEKRELQSQVSNILHEISEMEIQLNTIKKSHSELELENSNLNKRIEDMQNQRQDVDNSNERWHEQLIEKEDKLKQVESEHTQLAEKNCLLEENLNRLEKLLAEKERQQITIVQCNTELNLKLNTAESSILKLQEKMSEVLDENSRMHNAQELMDHDCRSLQDKCDTLEKEKLVAEDSQNCLQAELGQFIENIKLKDIELKELLSQSERTNKNLLLKDSNIEKLTREVETLKEHKDLLEKDKKQLMKEVEETEIAIRAERLQNKKKENVQKQKANQELLKQELNNLKEQFAAIEHTPIQLKTTEEELALMHSQHQALSLQLSEANAALNEKTIGYKQLEANAKDFGVLQTEFEVTKSELLTIREDSEKVHTELKETKDQLNQKIETENQLRQQLESVSLSNDDKLVELQSELEQLRESEKNVKLALEETETKYQLEVEDLQNKLGTANTDIEKLHESNDNFEVEFEQLTNKYQVKMQELERSLKQLQEQHEKLHSESMIHAENSTKLAKLEQLEIENDHLKVHTHQLEKELGSQNSDHADKLKSIEELKEKLKSIQCELYVLQENALKHEAQLKDKEKLLENKESELKNLEETLRNERLELSRQTEHTNFITGQNDSTEKQLLQMNQQVFELEQKLQNAIHESEVNKEVAASDLVIKNNELKKLQDEIANKEKIILELTNNDRKSVIDVKVTERIQPHLSHIDKVLNGSTDGKTVVNEAEHLRRINETLQTELENLKKKSVIEISSLKEEIDDLQNNSKHMTERLTVLETERAGLKAQRFFENSKTEPIPVGNNNDNLLSENAQLETKLKTIMNEVQDVSNRNLFLEQKCENFLILEQSNERLKLQNSKLSRQLDETLVSMQHNETISANTEFEYLKNIMFQYLTGSANGNNETLVKVISAVLKFSPQQTQVAIEKEHQRRSLINKIL